MYANKIGTKRMKLRKKRKKTRVKENLYDTNN